MVQQKDTRNLSGLLFQFMGIIIRYRVRTDVIILQQIKTAGFLVLAPLIKCSTMLMKIDIKACQ